MQFLLVLNTQLRTKIVCFVKLTSDDDINQSMCKMPSIRWSAALVKASTVLCAEYIFVDIIMPKKNMSIHTKAN